MDSWFLWIEWGSNPVFYLCTARPTNLYIEVQTGRCRRKRLDSSSEMSFWPMMHVEHGCSLRNRVNHVQQIKNHAICVLQSTNEKPRYQCSSMTKLLLSPGNAPWHKSQICNCWSVRDNVYGFLYVMMKNNSTAESMHIQTQAAHTQFHTPP